MDRSGQLVAGGFSFTADGQFTNDGHLTIGPGSALTVDGGAFDQSPGATLELVADGQITRGLLDDPMIVATAPSSIDGTLVVRLPDAGDIRDHHFALLAAPDITGQFDTTFDLPEGAAGSIEYTPEAVYVHIVVPAPPTGVLVLWAAATGRRRRRR